MCRIISSGKIAVWLAAIAAVCSACSGTDNDDSSALSGNESLLFKIDNGSSAALMDKGTTVGMFVTDKSDGGNLMLTVGENGVPENWQDVFPENSGQYTYVAYSPYNSGWTDLSSLVEFSVSNDQSSDMNYKAGDLQLSYGTVAWNGEMIFTHAMAEIVLHMTDLTGQFDLSSAYCVLHGLRLNSYVLLSDGTVQPDAATDELICHVLDSRDRRLSVGAVVPPQRMSGDELSFTVYSDGREYDFTLTGLPEFEGGQVYIYRLRMNERGLELEGSSVADWEDDGSGYLTADSNSEVR